MCRHHSIGLFAPEVARPDGVVVTLRPMPSADIGEAPRDDRPPALAQLVTAFNLSPFERDTLLLCVGMELDSEMPALCAAAQAHQAGTHQAGEAHDRYEVGAFQRAGLYGLPVHGIERSAE